MQCENLHQIWCNICYLVIHSSSHVGPPMWDHKLRGRLHWRDGSSWKLSTCLFDLSFIFLRVLVRASLNSNNFKGPFCKCIHFLIRVCEDVIGTGINSLMGKILTWFIIIPVVVIETLFEYLVIRFTYMLSWADYFTQESHSFFFPPLKGIPYLKRQIEIGKRLVNTRRMI